MLLTPSARYRKLLVVAAFLVAATAYQPPPAPAPDFSRLLPVYAASPFPPPPPEVQYVSERLPISVEGQFVEHTPEDLKKLRSIALIWAQDAFSEDPLRRRRAKEAITQDARDGFQNLYWDHRDCGHKVHFKIDSVNYVNGDDWLTLCGTFVHGSGKPMPVHIWIGAFAENGRLYIDGYGEPNAHEAEALATWTCNVRDRQVTEEQSGVGPTYVQYLRWFACEESQYRIP